MDNFTRLITDWYRQNKRDLPWRNTTDPYLIWLSEIILQQTRVDQGMSYYLKFKAHYPTITDLANASEESVLNDWQGLGYYSRARNLHFTAKVVRDQWKGEFPSSYEEIIRLKGIGEYTAAAISSFAFDLNHAVVDGNVYRLLSRVFNIDLPIDSSLGKKYFQELSNELIDPSNAAMHNQAIMEVGSQICTPKNPKCLDCPLENQCLALAKHTIDKLPVKSTKTKVRARFFHFMIFQNETHTVIEKRVNKDIWQNMYQFPLHETENNSTPKNSYLERASKISVEIKHILSHQKITAKFYHFNFIPEKLMDEWLCIPKETIQDYPLPRLIDRYLENNAI